MIRERRGPNAMRSPAKQGIHSSAQSDPCLATIPPSGRSDGSDRFIWEERNPFWRSWRTLPPTSICCSGSRWREAPIGRGGLSVLSIAPMVSGGTALPRPKSRERYRKPALHPALLQQVHTPQRACRIEAMLCGVALKTVFERRHTQTLPEVPRGNFAAEPPGQLRLTCQRLKGQTSALQV